MKRTILLTIMTVATMASFSQIRTNYREGMTVPDSVNLKAIAPSDLIELKLIKPFPNGFYTLYAKKNSKYANDAYIRLLNSEVKELMSKAWGKGTLSQKKKQMKDFLLAHETMTTEQDHMIFKNKRWHWCYINGNQIKDPRYIYPDGLDGVITEDDIKDREFGFQPNRFTDYSSFLPKETGVIHLEIKHSYPDSNSGIIVVQTEGQKNDQYYIRIVTKEECKDFEYSIVCNDTKQRKIKEVISKLISLGINTREQQGSTWGLYLVGNKENKLDFDNAKKILVSYDQAAMANPFKSMLFDYIRSRVFTKKEREWYDKHMTKEQQDAMLDAGIKATMGSGGPYSCKTCGASFSDEGSKQSHENAMGH